MPLLVRNNYARNLFRIMREFKLTPASPDFYNMTSAQLEFMVTSLNLDYKEEELQSKGWKEDSFKYDPEYSWEGEMDYGGEKEDTDQIKNLLGDEAFSKRQELLDDVLNNMDKYKENIERTKQGIDEFTSKHNKELSDRSNKLNFQDDSSDVDEI